MNVSKAVLPPRPQQFVYSIVTAALYIYTATMDHTVENFQVSSLDDTHVMFSWDIARDVRRSIQSFDIHYTYAYPGYVSTSYNRADGRVTIAVENAHYDPNSDDAQLKYNFTTVVTSFSNRAQYIMWLEARRTRNRPSLLSQQIYVEVGELIITMYCIVWVCCVLVQCW